MSNRKKLLLLYNPRSGRAQIARSLDIFFQKFCKAGWEPTVYPILEGMDAESILRETAGTRYDLVVCCGGDGTLHHTMNGLMQMENAPDLGYIPSGSTNDFASSLNLAKEPEAACDLILNGTPHPIDVGDFSGETFCYVAAFGAFSAVSYETPQEMKNAMGHLAYIIEGIRQLPLGQKYPARVEANGQVFEEDFLFCSISNTTYIGGIPLDRGVDASLDDGKFEVLLIKAPSNMMEANTIAAKLLARDFQNPQVQLLHTDRVTVRFPKPTAWSLDGEFGGEVSEVTVQVQHDRLKLVY